VSPSNFGQIDGVSAQVVTPFNNQNQWTLCDLGYLTLPIAPAHNLADLTQFPEWLTLAINDSNGSFQNAWINWVAFMPVDGGIFAATFGSPLVFQTTNQFFWVFSDGWSLWTTGQPVGLVGYQAITYPGSNYSTPNNAFPTYSLAIGGQGSSGTGSILPTQDAYLTLDPHLSLGSTTGVNEFVGLVTDLPNGITGATGNSGDVLPLLVDISYYPAWLTPK